MGWSWADVIWDALFAPPRKPGVVERAAVQAYKTATEVVEVAELTNAVLPPPPGEKEKDKP